MTEENQSLKMGDEAFRLMDAETTDLQVRLRDRVNYLAGQLGERNPGRYRYLEEARLYVERAFLSAGYPIRHDVYEFAGRLYRNVIAERPGSSPGVFIVGAHYDTAPRTPGADDNASGVASLLELARLLRDFAPGPTLRWVAFTLEEPPFFRTPLMGSRVHARDCRRRGERVHGMFSLEMVGYYDPRPGSQSYPLPFMSWFFPNRADFIAVAGNFGSRRLVRRTAHLLAETGRIPVEYAAIPLLPGAGLSDNWSFWQEGYPALMITDTAFFRNPNYHLLSDLPATLDYGRMASLVLGLESVIRTMAGRRSR